MLMIPFDICKIEVSKHFRNKYMREWNWDYIDLKEAIKNAYKIDTVGKTKYEAYTNKKGGKKIIFVYYSEFDTIFIISGSEGDYHERK